jgi:hypothetical protein
MLQILGTVMIFLIYFRVMGLIRTKILKKNFSLSEYLLGLVFVLFTVFLKSPHHGKGVCDSFGGEFRIKLKQILRTTSAVTFKEYFDMCESMFECQNSTPGEKRVSVIMFFFFFF